MTLDELRALLGDPEKTTGLNSHFYFTSNQPLDPIQLPLDTIDDLTAFTKAYKSLLYNGLEMCVLNNGKPIRFKLVGGASQIYWRAISLPIFDDITDVEALFSGSTVYRMLQPGTEFTVKTTEGFKKYVVSELNSVEKTQVFALAETKPDIKEDVETIVDQLMSSKYGNVVYPTSNVYSYTDESGKTIYTQDEEEASGKENYTVYPEGFYVINKNEAGDTVLSEIVTQNSQDGLSINVVGDDF